MPDGARKGRPLRVALVNMPFSSARFPSIQLGLLQSILARRGIPATSHYLNLEFAARIGWKRYEWLSDNTLCFVGDWMFARAAFRERAPDGRLFLQRFGKRLGKSGAVWLWSQHREGAQAFLENCLASVPWHQYDVVGFSSVFVQNCAALALARLLKERHTQLITVFGGANFEDEMGLEYVRALPWVDYGVLGEADEASRHCSTGWRPATMLCRCRGLRAGVASASISAARRHWSATSTIFPFRTTTISSRPAPGCICRAPPRRTASSCRSNSARGCWWGEKHHCTFCGLNALGMSYRSKSPPRILSEIDELNHRYRTRYLGAMDNILDHQHIEGVFGVLAAQQTDLRFFYEVKANLRREQIRLLAQGGIWRVQPGIESLNTHILQLMRKGISAIKNFRFMKWATYYGIRLSWNMLLGFPGETEEDYAAQVEVIKLIPHLPPPSGAFRISLERFSPNYTQAAEMGFDNVRPFEGYSYIYPAEIDKRRIAYFFEYNARATLPSAAYVPLGRAIRRWQKRSRDTAKPYLHYAVEDDTLTVFDGREPGEARVHRFSALAARIYEFCSSTDRSVANILAHLRRSDPEIGDATIEGVVRRFLGLGLMFEEDGSFLSLALPKQPNL